MKTIAAADIRSVVGKNVSKLKEEFDLDPWIYSSRNFMNEYKD